MSQDVNRQAEPARASDTPETKTASADEFRFHRAKHVRLIEHSEGIAVIDRTGAVTVLDAALVRSAYDLVMRDRLPVIDAREVRG